MTGYFTEPWTKLAVVGPIVYFRGRDHAVPVEQSPPRDTMDGDRWAKCTSHHLACDCREAEKNEQLTELRSELRLIQDQLKASTDGHPTFVEERYGSQRRRDLECRCTACHVVRTLAGTSAVSRFDNIIQF